MSSRTVRRIRIAAALGPALTVSGGLTLGALALMVAESFGVGEPSGLVGAGADAYRSILGADGFFEALFFSLWVAVAGTSIASVGAIALSWLWTTRPGRMRSVGLGVLHLNLSIPHIVWAAALAATFSQSGWMSRLTALVGITDVASDFPVVVRDPWGIGIITHLVTKEMPFITLTLLPLAGRRAAPLLRQAAVLGASPMQRLRTVFVPTIAPALFPATMISFAFAIGAFEPGLVLGSSSPRTLAVVTLDRFRDADLARRSEGQALSVLLLLIVFVAAGAGWWRARRWIVGYRT